MIVACKSFIRLKKWLLNRQGRVFQVYLHVFINLIYHPMQRVYAEHYLLPSNPSVGSLKDARTRSNEPKVDIPVPTTTITEPKDESDNIPVQSIDWQWQGLPKIPSWLMNYRKFTTIYMMYVVVKYAFPRELELIVENVFRTSKPGNCYIPGRFILIDSVERFTAILYAGYHLIWRYIQWTIYNPLEVSSMYFLMLDDRDIIKGYELLATKSRLRETKKSHHSKMKPSKYSHHTPTIPECQCWTRQIAPPPRSADHREQFMLDVMSYRVDYFSGPVFRLRPNRTPKACKQLRECLANSTIICAIIFIILAFSLTYLIVYVLAARAQRVINHYPGCNPELERLVASGQLSPDTRFYFNSYILIVFPIDILENLILWVESGLVTQFTPAIMYVVNTDLITYWAHLQNKLESTVCLVKEFGDALDDNSLELKPGLEQSASGRGCMDEIVLDLEVEMQDFIKQIKQADYYLSDCASTIVSVWFSLLGFFIYATANDEKGLLPLPLKLTLLLVGIVLSAVCIDLLRLHRSSKKMYRPICSLMACVQIQYKRNFCSMVDYFIYDRTCYTLFRSKALTPTFFITIIGWSLSCYFMLGKIDKGYASPLVSAQYYD